MRPSGRKYSEDSVLEGRRHRPDYLLIVIISALAIIGLIVIYSISPAVALLGGLNSGYYFNRHLISVLLGLILFALFFNLPLSFIKKLTYPIAALAVMLSAVILIKEGIAFRWLQIGGISFQPAELIKLGVILWLSFFLANTIRSHHVANMQSSLKPPLIVLSLAGILLVFLQRDLGSMVVVAAIMTIILFIANVPLKPLILVGASLLVLASIAILSTPYRRDRFETFMNPQRDCQNEGYHACQALITIGSGGLIGLGVGNSVQAYGYLPESPTDSIFAIYAEKFGFIGSVILIALLGTLVMRLLTIARRTQSWEARLVTIGVTAWIAIQSVINIGAMLGLLPLKGITLPFVSYGGSSLLLLMASLGIVLRISCYTSLRKHNLETSNQQDHPARGWGNRRSYHAPLGSRRAS